jgi:hypothetical protein
VVAAIDDFNNKPISRNQLHVWIEGEKPAIQKEEGYYVFVNLRRTEFVLNIEGGLYHRKEISIDSTKLSQYKGKVLKVRMFPNRSYPIPQNTTCIEGKAEKNSVVLAYSETYANPYKLLYSYQSGETQISIFHPEEADIEGKTMLIKNKEETQAEFFKAEEKQEDEKAVYSLGEPLSHAYKKIGTVIYPVYTMETDSNGEFYLPVNHIYDEKVEFTFCTRGENESEWNRKNVELRTGRVNKIDLR